MKKSLIIFLLFVPVICFARIGWSFSSYSFLFGQQYRYNQKSIFTAELQYDFFRTSCTVRPVYYGASITYSEINNYSELGFKGMWNPTRIIIMANNILRFYPYMFTQANYFPQDQRGGFTSGMRSIGNYGVRTGIGLAGNFPELKILNFRCHIQLGYHQSYTISETFSNSLVVEFKIGAGINVLAIKRKSHNSDETTMLHSQF